MPNKSGQEAVTAVQTLTERDFLEAYRAVKICGSPLRRRGVRAGICLTAAALAASVIPSYYRIFLSAQIPVCVVAVFLTAAAAFWFLQPAAESRYAERLFRACPLMALPSEIRVEYDRVTVKSERERYTEYWTDFAFCVETPGLFAASGGCERRLLIVEKNSLSQEETVRLQALLSNGFAGRYHRIPR